MCYFDYLLSIACLSVACLIMDCNTFFLSSFDLICLYQISCRVYLWTEVCNILKLRTLYFQLETGISSFEQLVLAIQKCFELKHLCTWAWNRYFFKVWNWIQAWNISCKVGRTELGISSSKHFKFRMFLYTDTLQYFYLYFLFLTLTACVKHPTSLLPKAFMLAIIYLFLKCICFPSHFAKWHWII